MSVCLREVFESIEGGWVDGLASVVMSIYACDINA